VLSGSLLATFLYMNDATSGTLARSQVVF